MKNNNIIESKSYARIIRKNCEKVNNR